MHWKTAVELEYAELQSIVFNKVAGLRFKTQKETPTQVLPVHFTKFLRTPILHSNSVGYFQKLKNGLLIRTLHNFNLTYGRHLELCKEERML